MIEIDNATYLCSDCKQVTAIYYTGIDYSITRLNILCDFSQCMNKLCCNCEYRITYVYDHNTGEFVVAY